MADASQSEIFRWLEERQVDKTLMDEGFSEDFYDILFVFLFDFYILFMLQWRKVKWAARQVKALNDRHEGLMFLISWLLMILFTQDALRKWNKCCQTITSHISSRGALQLSSNFEAMIEEDLKWEYIYWIEFILRINMCCPILSAVIGKFVIAAIGRLLKLTYSPWITTMTFLLMNVVSFAYTQYSINYVYKVKYSEYRHYFEK